MPKLTIATQQRKQVIDIGEQLTQHIPAGRGICTVTVLHTTAAVTTADLDPGTDQDLLDALAAMVPELNYRHPHNPAHVGDHILASLIGPNLVLPFADGRLRLGTWQRPVLVELDGPRERSMIVEYIMTG